VSSPESEGPVPLVEFDAPLADRAELDAWLTGLRLDEANGTPRPGRTVVAAGRQGLVAPGDRTPRAAAAAASVDAGARGNWIPTGPRNITGRVRALAVHPTDPTIMYAGAASGGVFKSIDGGETWFPSWEGPTSVSIAAISICRDHPETVWVATGEIQAGGGESILGTGIYRSIDSGANWTKIDNPGAVGAAKLPTTFDGLAAHPTNTASCWAVGPDGIFRILAEVTAGGFWAQFAAGDYYSDVAFSVDAAAPPNPIVFLVRGVSAAGETTVVRIDKPDDPVPNVAAAIGPPKVPPAAAGVPNPANASQPNPAPGALPPANQMPTRGKIAICAGTPAVAYVRFCQQDDNHFGIFRTVNAQVLPASAVHWDPIPPDSGFAAEGQGSYDLAIGVNPNNANEIATGMTDVYVSTNANGPVGAVTFNRALAEDLTFADRAQHGDQHTTLIVPPPAAAPAGTPPTLWVSNDGGISRSTDWQTGTSYVRGSTILPLPAGVTTWRKSFGISAGQPYSISQSPLLPTVFACGFQDNGVLLTAGGPTWRTVVGADGGFIAFDPVDPYKLFVSYAAGQPAFVDEVLFPGKLEGGFALPGFPVREGIWPRDLTQGFLPTDDPLFVADTAHHPRHRDRVLHARRNRLYGSTEKLGDRWVPETAGRGLELQLTVPASVATPRPTSTLAVTATDVATAEGAARLGLSPQVSFVLASARKPAVATVRSMLPGPYALRDGDALSLTLNGAPLARIVFNRPADKVGVPWSAAEVSATINAAAQAAATPQLVAYTCFWPHPLLVEVTTTELGANAQIKLDGSAVSPAAGTGPLGLRGRTYRGSPNRPATVTLVATTNLAPPAGQPPLELKLTVGAGGDTRTVTFDGDTFADLAFIHAGELQRAIKAALHDDPATVTAHAVEKRLRIAATAGTLTLGGSAAPRLNMPNWTAATPTAAVFEAHVNIVNSFNLAPPTAGPNANVPLQLTINDGANPVKIVTFNGTQNALLTFSAEELEFLLQTQLAGLNATCSLEFFPTSGRPTEIAYSTAAPDTAWVGSSDGTLCKTTNDGGLWQTIADPLVYGLDRSIEAIAIHPSDPDTVYVGLEGRPTLVDQADPAPLTKPGLLFKTTNGGGSWSHVGGDVKDTNGGLLGVYALQIDPAAPDTVFAATEVGVFRSTDGGSSWNPFNEGLPSGIVRDLAFVPERRVLRAGVWGRGSYEREVGSAAAKDVLLYVRANDLDDGSVRPAPRGPDVYASEPRLLPRAASPDIKVNRDDPPTVVGGRLMDGVEFDDDVVHEDLVSGAATVFVQVHNRGAFDATAVRVVCLWADASAGPPPLPADFWTRFRAKTFGGLDPSWTLIADTTLTDPAAKNRDRVPPGYPRNLRLPVNWPADIATRRRVGILLLAECAENQLAATALDVGALLDAEQKAAYRETGTVQDRDDQTILLRQTSAVQFTVSAPPGGLAPGTAVLAPATVLPTAPANSQLGDTQATFALAPVAGNNQALTFAVPAQTVTVTFNNGMFNPAAARLGEVATIINHQCFKNGVPLGVDPNQLNLGNLVLQAGAGAVFQVTGGTAAATLGFPVGGPLVTNMAAAIPGPYNLAGPPAPTLVLSVTPQATVQFAAQPGFNPVAAPARTVRRLLNRELAGAHLPIRCVTPRLDLWIRRSITDVDGIPSPVASRGFADLVASPTAVPPANQPALFDLVQVHHPDLVRPSNDNLLYLRVGNLGNNDLADVPTVNSRHRLFAVAITAAPISLTQIGADIHQPVPAESSAIVEFHWNPGAAATGDRLFVLAVSDDQTHQPLQKGGAPLTAATTFATVDELDSFCAAHPNAAYRMFTVGT
jgi:hypothetical protein